MSAIDWSKVIGVTHNGRFHADDVHAAAVLAGTERSGRGRYFLRTRDEAVFAAAEDRDVSVFDVGGVYDHDRRRYDHHQPGGAGARPNGVAYAAFGLVWRHHGAEFCRQALSAYSVYRDVDVDELVAAVDESYVAGVDAGDTGQLCGDKYVTRPDDTVQRVQLMTVSALVGDANPVAATPEAYDAQFGSMAYVVGEWLRRHVLRTAERLRFRAAVRAGRRDGAVLVLDEGGAWAEVVVAEMPDVHFVVFPDTADTVAPWRVQVVPRVLGQFAARRDLPAAWAALRGAELQAATGVPDAVFCHGKRFIAGAESRDGALALARLACG